MLVHRQDWELTELVHIWFHQCLKDFLKINLPTSEEWDRKDHLVEVAKVLTVRICTARDGESAAERKETKQALPEEVIVVHT